jgi:hypothetical protein
MNTVGKIALVAAGMILLSSPVIAIAMRVDEPQDTPEHLASLATIERAAPQHWAFRAAYDDIEVGTPFEVVQTLNGWPGEEVSSFTAGDSVTRVVQWVNPDRTFMICTFLDGKLTGKQSFRLP